MLIMTTQVKLPFTPLVAYPMHTIQVYTEASYHTNSIIPNIPTIGRDITIMNGCFLPKNWDNIGGKTIYGAITQVMTLV